MLLNIKKNPVSLVPPFPKERGPTWAIEKCGGVFSRRGSPRATGQDQKLCSNILGAAGMRKEAVLNPALYKRTNQTLA